MLAKFDNLSRLLPWLLISILLSVAALYVQAHYPGNVLAVTLYKMHLMSLGGWGGYWLDRALFPYDRPHEYLAEPELVVDVEGATSPGWTHKDWPDQPGEFATGIARDAFGYAMIRRAIIVAASLLCVGLGA